ncbi:MAG: TrkH family potassium uptake protein [Thermoanaerobaculia bacterium]
MATAPSQPVRSILLSFLVLILAGTAALKLPAATPPEQPINWIDALFTATSAVCVTGLIVRDTGSAFTVTGQAIVVALIQLGGLGIMTFGLLIAAGIRGKLSLAGRQLIEHTLAGSGARGELWALLRLVVTFTFFAELAGAAAMFVAFKPGRTAAEAAWTSVFHSISAFCNAGFSLWSDSLMAFQGSWWVNLIFMALIVFGGLGFLTLYEMRRARGRFQPLSLHAKLVLTVTAVLVVGGAVLFRLAETGEELADAGLGTRVLASLFQSVTARTAGFNTVDTAALAPAALFVIILLMYVGGSPGSTAGGVKTTTLGVLALASWHRLRHRQHVNAFRRTIPPITVQNTLAIAMTGIAVTLVGLLVLLFIEAPPTDLQADASTFLDYLFETVSALNTVGLSTGVTPTLSPAGRLWVTLLMFVGRLGPLTFAAALIASRPRRDWQHPTEEVVVG